MILRSRASVAPSSNKSTAPKFRALSNTHFFLYHPVTYIGRMKFHNANKDCNPILHLSRFQTSLNCLVLTPLSIYLCWLITIWFHSTETITLLTNFIKCCAHLAQCKSPDITSSEMNGVGTRWGIKNDWNEQNYTVTFLACAKDAYHLPFCLWIAP